MNFRTIVIIIVQKAIIWIPPLPDCLLLLLIILQEPHLDKTKPHWCKKKCLAFSFFPSSHNNPIQGMKASDKLKEMASLLLKPYPCVNSLRVFNAVHRNSVTAKQTAARRLCLPAAICHLASRSQTASAKLWFCQYLNGSEEMPCVCVFLFFYLTVFNVLLGATEESRAQTQSVLNYYQSPVLMTSCCQTHHP